MSTKSWEVTINVLFWLVTGWLICTSFSIESHEIEIINNRDIVRIVRNQTLIYKLLGIIGVSMIMFYIHRFNIYRNLDRSSFLKIFFQSLGILSISIVTFRFSEFIINPTHQVFLPPAIYLGIFIFYFVISTCYGVIQVLMRSNQQKQQLTLAKKQAELNLLRNQLQPHFLFNALNNLLSMVDQQQSPRLSRAFDQLSQLLRYAIEQSKSQRVSVQSEIEFIRNYAAMQKLRFEEDEIDFKFNILGDYTQQQIEPGLFIPFVENAFKYGTSPEEHSIIEIHMDLSEPHLIIFSVRNEIHNDQQKTHQAGTGIKVSRERLNLIYPDKHRLEIFENKDFIIKLQIDTR